MIPKSLHTITAFAKLGTYLLANNLEGATSPAEAAARAAVLLGYPCEVEHPDTYGLIDKAAATIAKGAR